MRLDRFVAAARPVLVGGEYVLVSPPSLRGLGLVFRFLRGAIARPPGVPADWSPSLGDPESVRALVSPGLGLGVLLHVAMQRDQPEVRLAWACRASADLDPGSLRELVDVVLVRDRPESTLEISHWVAGVAPRSPRGGQVDRVNIGKLAEHPQLAGFAPDEIAEWTVDQLQNKLAGGEPDPATEGVPLSMGDTTAWFARMADPAERERVREIRRAEQDAARGEGGLP